MTARKKAPARRAAKNADANGSATELQESSPSGAPATKKVYTRTFYYLVDDKRAPGGKKLAVIALDYQTPDEDKAANELTAHMELGRQFPTISAGSVRHVYSENSARIESVNDDG